MSRLIVVSNRVTLPGNRKTESGGLAVAMREALQHKGGVWFGWSGEVNDGRAMQPRTAQANGVTYLTVDLAQADYDQFYVGYANGTLWPLMHYRLGLIDFRREDFEGYLRVNRRFAETLRPHIGADDVIWVHDYHLIPLARELRRLGVGNRIGFFLHTPFPAAEVLVAAPGHKQLLEGLCSFDLIGFQTDTDLRCFQDAIAREARGLVRPDGSVRAFGRATRAEVFPIGIDTAGFAATAAAAVRGKECRRLVESLRGRALVLGVDRLDYSKGLPHRLRGFERLLERCPEHRGKVSFMQIAPPSRTDVAEYQKLREELEALAGHVNTRYAEFDWVPVHCLSRNVPRQTIAGFYRTSRMALVTPLRDGMNLVAKEYVAAQNSLDPGVLVLSRFAGAARELGEGALIVNPFDPDAIAEALDRGLRMGLEERRQRWRAMMAVLEINTLERWRRTFLEALTEDAAPVAPRPRVAGLPPPPRPTPGQRTLRVM